MGQSRSATIVIAYLISKGKTLQQAYWYVKERRRMIEPNTGFLFQLYKFSESFYPKDKETMLFIYKMFGQYDTNEEIDEEKAQQFVNDFSAVGFHRRVYWNKYLIPNPIEESQ